MNNEQQELLDDVYKNFLKYSSQVIPFTKDEFIHHIKTNDGFAKLWGLKIEERELSLEERNYSLGHGKSYLGIFGMNDKDDLRYKELFDKENRPTKLITITYKDKTIESYE
jgi:hypothetical protein